MPVDPGPEDVDPDDAPGSDPVHEESLGDGGDEPRGIDAARAALARARAAASMRPTTAPGRRSAAAGPRRSPTSATRSGPGPDDRDPQLLGPSVDRIMRERGWQEPTAVGGLTGRWHEIVGADIAEHVVPETFAPAPDGRGLILVLRADSSAWATSMRLLLPQVRARIDLELGSGVVRDISILGPAAPSWKHGRFHIPGRGPRDTYG